MVVALISPCEVPEELTNRIKPVPALAKVVWRTIPFEIDPSNKKCQVNLVDFGFDEDFDKELDLNKKEGWQEMIKIIRENKI